MLPFAQNIEGLYQKFAADLMRVRERQKQFYFNSGYFNPTWKPSPSGQSATPFGAKFNRVRSYLRTGALLKPQLDDVEAELTYLRIRALRPTTVVEVSPCGGWSSTWILSALRDNAHGELHSFDIQNIAPKNVPKDLCARWHFYLGDAQEQIKSLAAPIDYLFIDSDHSAAFAQWYIRELFPRCRQGVAASVHDVFHTHEAGGFDTEGPVLMRWLETQGKQWFTASPQRDPECFKHILRTKERLALSEPIHVSAFNSMVFFEF